MAAYTQLRSADHPFSARPLAWADRGYSVGRPPGPDGGGRVAQPTAA